MVMNVHTNLHFRLDWKTCCTGEPHVRPRLTNTQTGDHKDRPYTILRNNGLDSEANR